MDIEGIELTEEIRGEAIMPREVDEADHAVSETPRAALDRLYAARAFAYRVLDEADGHHTDAELDAYDAAGDAIDRWLARHDAEVAAKALEDAAAEVYNGAPGRLQSLYNEGANPWLLERAARIRRDEQP